MGTKREIDGFLHYRTDLGDGMQTGVFFSACKGSCGKFCGEKLLPEHDLGLDTPEKRSYSEEELIEYLLEEKKWCASRNLGISFLGGEPLSNPWFCLTVAKALKAAGMKVSFRICGNIPPSYLYHVHTVTDLFLFDFFTLVPVTHYRLTGFPLDRSLEVLSFLERKEYPYRLRLHVLPDVNEKDPAVFAMFCKSLSAVKSVILDFSRSTLSQEERGEYRKVFLSQNVILY